MCLLVSGIILLWNSDQKTTQRQRQVNSDVTVHDPTVIFCKTCDKNRNKKVHTPQVSFKKCIYTTKSEWSEWRVNNTVASWEKHTNQWVNVLTAEQAMKVNRLKIIQLSQRSETLGAQKTLVSLEKQQRSWGAEWLAGEDCSVVGKQWLSLFVMWQVTVAHLARSNKQHPISKIRILSSNPQRSNRQFTNWGVRLKWMVTGKTGYKAAGEFLQLKQQTIWHRTGGETQVK